MSAVFALVALALHLALLLAVAPLLVGALGWTRARLAGAAGPPVLQPWRDLLRLARKQPVVTEGASWLFLAAPAARLAVLVAAAALVPSFSNGMATAGLADLLVIAGLLALARAIQVLAALDSAVPAGAVAASRATVQAGLAEPALLASVFALGAATGTTHLPGIVVAVREAGLVLAGPLLLLALALLAVALAANGRLPVANPAARHKAAMLDPAMALPYGGRHLALLEFGDALRLLLWLSLLVALFAPAGIAAAGVAPGWWLPGLLAWAGKIAVLVLSLAVLESLVPAMRRAHLPAVLGAALLMALLAVLVLFAGQGGGLMRGSDEVALLLETAALILALVLLGRRRLPACIAVQAAQAATVAVALGWRAWSQGSATLALAAVLVLGIQGLAMTLALRHVVRRLRLAAPVAVMPGRLALGGAVAALALLLAPALPALAVALVGGLGMLVRGSAVAQAIGLLALGNGVLLAAAGAPALAPVAALAVPALPGLMLLGIHRFGLRDGFDAAGEPAP